MAEIESVALKTQLIKVLKPIGGIALSTFLGGLVAGPVGAGVGGAAGSVGIAISQCDSWNDKVGLLINCIKQMSFKDLIICLAKCGMEIFKLIWPVLFSAVKMIQAA